MTIGTLYGIGVGPGDPDLITVKGAALLATCPHVVVPKASDASESTALTIALKHIGKSAMIHEVVFPMVTRKDTLEAKWAESAARVLSLLSRGEDVCFPTLGDPMLYSTYIYLVREVKRLSPDTPIVTVPGIPAFCAVAAAAGFAVGEEKEPVTILPTAENLAPLKDALTRGGTVVIMKIGKKLDPVLDLLEEHGALGGAVFGAHVGMPHQQMETDLRRLRGTGEKTGYLSIILARGGKEAVR